MTSQAADHRRATAEAIVRSHQAACWLVTSFFALIHACAGDVHAGRLDAVDAQRVLTLTVTDLFAGGRR